MKIMKICNKISNTAKPRVNWARDLHNRMYPVDEALKTRINTIKPNLEAVAKEYKTNITLAQNGDLLMVNSGAITTPVDFKKASYKNLYNSILNNVYANRDAGKGRALGKILAERKV